MNALNISNHKPPGAETSRLESLRGLWRNVGLQNIQTRPIGISIVYSDFEEFWQSNSIPASPGGKAINDLSPSAKERLRAQLREQLPVGADGRIVYGASANAVKGQVP